MTRNVIVGSGISGLLAGLLLSKKGEKVIIIEKESEIGGLLKSYDYGEYGVFDYGMHNFLETGVFEIDKSILELLPIEKWNILEGDKRDLAGLYFNGKIQFNSPYIDVRDWDADDLIHLREIFKSTINRSSSPPKNAEEYGIQRFGRKIYENTLKLALEKIYKKSPRDLDVASIHLTPLSRLIIADEFQTLLDYKSEYLRDRIAYPEQRNLPLNLSSGRKGYYPRDYGIYRVVECLKKEIKLKGGKIYTNSSISHISLNEGKIENLLINRGGKFEEHNNIKSLVWTANIFPLGKILKIPTEKHLKYDRPLDTYVVNILIDKKPKLKDLYYFFCYDKQFNTFRLTNFTAYCENAKRNNQFPLSLELLIDPYVSKKLEEIESIAVNELLQFDILEENTNITFIKAEKLSSGIPMLSLNNTSSLKTVRDKIKGLKLDNLIITGVLSENNLFFQTDVLKDVYNKVLK